MKIRSVVLRIGLIVWLGIGWESLVEGQGRMLDPPGRSSLWRVGYEAPINLNDNALSCGGVKHRWEANKGRCGVCGDPWDSNPRQNEAGGKYATGMISRVYASGSVIQVTIDIAVANGGYFEFRLCPNNNFSKPVTEKCLDNGILTLEDGSRRFGDIVEGMNTVSITLPDKLECDQCVLQWKYRTADHLGCDVNETTKEQICEFGRGLIQTEYFACADVAIVKDMHSIDNKLNAFSVVPEDGKAANASKSSRKKRFAHFRDGQVFHNEPGHGNNVQLPYFSLSQMTDRQYDPSFVPLIQQRRVQLRWIEPTGSKTQSRMRRRAHFVRQPRRSRFFSSQSSRFGTSEIGGSRNFNVGRGEFFPGTVPVSSLIQVQQPTVRQIFRGEEGATVSISSPFFRQTETTNVQDVYIDPRSAGFGPQVNHRVKSTHSVPVTQCNACPFDMCLDKPFELNKLFPGLFQDPLKFLECVKYEKLFNLKKYKLVSDGLPDCTHPRFKRQLVPAMPMEDDDVGCCATRPQVIMPLTVESDNDTFTVVQLPNDRNQFLVQGLCGQNRTVSCGNCEAENNFQWVLVYDPKSTSNPPVAFVPVKFRHYCRCVNRGRRFIPG